MEIIRQSNGFTLYGYETYILTTPNGEMLNYGTDRREAEYQFTSRAMEEAPPTGAPFIKQILYIAQEWFGKEDIGILPTDHPQRWVVCRDTVAIATITYDGMDATVEPF